MQEETKHEKSNFNDSINAEIDQMLLGNFTGLSNNKMAVVEEEFITKKPSKINNCFDLNTSNINGNMLRIGSNNSELERLASLILNENSTSKDKMEFSRKLSNSKLMDALSRQASSQNKLNEAEKIYLEYFDNQPDEKIFKKRKIAAQYTPYGIFAKESGGL